MKIPTVPSAWFRQARRCHWRRCTREGSEGWRRGCVTPREMRQDLVDHGWIFDARDHLDRTTTVFTGLDLDLEHALQPLGPRHRDVPGWRRISSRLGRAPAALAPRQAQAGIHAVIRHG